MTLEPATLLEITIEGAKTKAFNNNCTTVPVTGNSQEVALANICSAFNT